MRADLSRQAGWRDNISFLPGVYGKIELPTNIMGEFLKPAPTSSSSKYAWVRSLASASIGALGVIAYFLVLSIMFKS
jgi:hypothetical protein